MKFSTSFILFLGVALILLVSGNVVSVVYYAPKYFQEYVRDVAANTPSDEYALITSFIESKDLDAATIEEYRLTLEDLRSLTKSLENISRTIESKDFQSTTNALEKIGFSSDNIRQTIYLNGVQAFLQNLVSVATSPEQTPERNFLVRILTLLLIVNSILISALLLIVFIWTRITFRPIISLSDRLRKITEEGEYREVYYTRKDEFAPLVKAVNTLSVGLARQEKIRSDFLSDFSHEIKTPITALKMFIEGVEDGVVWLDEKGIRIIQGELDRLIHTTDSIMQYERVNAIGTQGIVVSRFDIREILEEMRTEYEPTSLRQKQTIQLELGGSFLVTLDRWLMIQVIHNAFSNFFRYAGEETTLTVRHYRRAWKLFLIFRDDGNGVASDHLPYLREKFYQEDFSRTLTGDRGIGIGLSLIEKIAKLHGGYLDIESKASESFELRIILSEPLKKEDSSLIFHPQSLISQKANV